MQKGSSTLSLKPSSSIVFKGISKVETETHESDGKKGVNEPMLDMLQPDKYSPLEVKDGLLNVFKREDIHEDVWLLPVIPDMVKSDVGSGK